MGSYQEINDAVSITRDKVEEAGQRLVDYNLIIGTGTQEAVTAYEKAVAGLQSRKRPDGARFQESHRRPDHADPHRPGGCSSSEGFPVVVNAFRYTMATLVSLFYGLKEVAYVVSEAVIQSFKAMGDVVSRVVGAIAKAATGNVEGAWNDLKAVPDDLGKRWNAFGDNVVAQSVRNAKAMALAWGADNFAAGSGADPEKTGKKWYPPKDPDPDKPKSKDGGSAAEKESQYQLFINQLDQMNARMESNQYTMLKVKAAQLAWNEGISATTALQKIESLQIAESDKAVKDYSTRIEEENRRLLDARGSIGLYGIELDAFILREYRRADVKARINQLEAAGKPLTDAARDALLQEADAAAQVAEAILRQNDALSRTYEVGAKRAFDAYMDHATNAAQAAERQFTDAFRGIEGAMADFLFDPFEKGTQGMLASFGKMLQRMIAEAVAADLGRRIFGAAGSSGGLVEKLLGGAAGLLGYGMGTGTLGNIAAMANGYQGLDHAALAGSVIDSFAVGTDYVPRDMLAMIHQGEKIIPAAQNVPGAGGQTNHITINLGGNQTAPGLRQSAGQVARAVVAELDGFRRFA
jgi:hypothetical protein